MNLYVVRFTYERSNQTKTCLDCNRTIHVVADDMISAILLASKMNPELKIIEIEQLNDPLDESRLLIQEIAPCH